jgi:hypothetical protein
MTRKVDYSMKSIRKQLESYDSHRKANTFDVDQAIINADIDLAIDSLGEWEKKYITARYIIGHPLEELERMFPGIDITKLEDHSILDMYHFLNGECQFYRWCRENGLTDTDGHTRIPDDLPPELDQYIKDICIDYCVIDECPE